MTLTSQVARLCIALPLLALAPRLVAAPADVAHPFILWNKQDIAAIRARVKAHDWAKAEVEKLKGWRGYGEVHRNLFMILVMDDKETREAEKKYLLSFIGAKVDSRPWSDNYLSALRYDVLYDRLTPDERRRIEATFRTHIRHEIDKDRRTYTRTNWLPNMQWPRKNGAMLMAVAMRDEKLIRQIFAANGGWKWYFDDYVSDGYFYNEEFGKHYSNIGEMLLWCRGLERLGLDELGFGYVGKGASGGATMRKYLEAIHLVGYPRVDVGTDRYHYPKMTMGDAKGKRGFPGYAFQHNIVKGYLTDGSGGDARFTGANMNGRDHKNRKVEKLRTPMWFEIAHAKWPDAHFDYFLAQMRPPGKDKYYPSLFWGLAPIDPDDVSPPPAPSGAYRQRGIAVLRWDQSPGYWQLEAPAVTMRFATPYVHDVPDVFAITGFYAFNRPIYLNRQVSAGYAGTDPGWSNSIRSHASVQIDGMEPRTVGELPHRCDFTDLAKFVAVRGKGIYPGVDQTRALLLTKDYLLDVFALSSDRPRSYQWMVHGLGHACPDNPDHWAPTRHLVGTIFDVTRERSCVADKTWAMTSTQITAGAHPEYSGLGKRWFDAKNRVGVRMTMLGEEGTIAYSGLGPVYGGAKERIYHGAAEPGGVTIAAARSKPKTVFIALHEPFRGCAKIAEFRQLARTNNAVLVHIGRPGGRVDDLAMLRWGDKADEPVTLSGQGHAVVFSSYGLVRRTASRIDAVGDLQALRLSVGNARPALTVNGKRVAARIADGQLSWGRPLPAPPKPQTVNAPPTATPIAVRWSTDMVRLARGAKGKAVLNLRNVGVGGGSTGERATGVTGRLNLVAPHGITVAPDRIDLRRFAAGDELDVAIELTAAKDAPSMLDSVRLRASDRSSLAVQAAELRVSHGVTAERTQIWPRDFASTVYAPRYVMKFRYLENTAAAIIRDGVGLRRTAGGVFRPQVLIVQKGNRGRARPTPMKLNGFQAFSPKPRAEADGRRLLADMGRHPHGYRSPFEWRFYEDWIIVRLSEPPAERVVYDWSARGKFRQAGVNADIAAAKLPGSALYALADGRIAESRPKEGTPVAATFVRSAGFVQGLAAFYASGSTIIRDGLVAQPADRPAAMTFCTDSEFPAFVKKWKALGKLTPHKPWGQGDMGR